MIMGSTFADGKAGLMVCLRTGFISAALTSFSLASRETRRSDLVRLFFFVHVAHCLEQEMKNVRTDACVGTFQGGGCCLHARNPEESAYKLHKLTDNPTRYELLAFAEICQFTFAATADRYDCRRTKIKSKADRCRSHTWTLLNLVTSLSHSLLFTQLDVL